VSAMTKVNFFDVVRQLFNRSLCDEALLPRKRRDDLCRRSKTICVDSRMQTASTIFHHRIPPASIGD
jgi:hypothetical protein